MAGEDHAWNLLYQRYYTPLYATAIQQCGNFSEAKDIVQDTFVTAWLKISQLKDARTFGGWLRTILIRNCYEWRHKDSRRKDTEAAAVPREHLIEYELEKELEHLSTEKRLSTVLLQLPEKLRITLLLRYFSSFGSYNAISQILTVPVGTVRSRLNEAKLQLLENWKQYQESEGNVIKESNEWNEFYFHAYSGMHFHSHEKKRLINHLSKSVEIVLPGGQSNIGTHVFENMLADDNIAGSYLTPVNVVTSGNISVIETNHHNSVEHPRHCPPRSVTILFRKKTEVAKMKLHISWE